MVQRITVPPAISGPLLTAEQLAPAPAVVDQVTPQQYRSRVAACEACEHRVPADCQRCGWGRCNFPGITIITQPVPLRASSGCPLHLWASQ